MTGRHLVKLIAALCTLALAMLTLLGQLTWTAYQESIHAAQTRTADYAAILNAKLDTSLRRVDANLRQLVRLTPVAALDQKAISRYVSGLGAEWRSSLIDFPELRSLSIFDANGDVLYSTNADLARLNISDRGHFRALRDNPQAELVFSEVVIARISGWATVSAARALRNDKGVFLGIAVATLDLSYFDKLFQSLAVGAGGNVALYRSDDFTLVLRQPRLEGRLNIPLPPDSPTRAALATGNKMVSIMLTAASDGRERIYSYHVLERFPFFVSVGVAKDEVLASWRVRSLAVGFSAVLFFGVMIGLLVRLWRTEAGRTRAIEATFENRELLNSIIDSTPAYIYAYDRQHRFILANAAAARIYGVSKQDALGKSLHDFFPREFADTMLATNERVMASDEPQFGEETVLQNGDNTPQVTISSKFPLRDARGMVIGMGGVSTDITALKVAEAARESLAEQLRESQKMQAVGTLAGGIAHDFNNILAIILGNVELARQDVGANAEAIESLDEIQQAGTRARDLVRQILAFSRRQPTERKLMALGPVVLESARLLRATLPARISLEVQCDAQTPPVLADATQMQQVVINLATNAMQAMPTGPGRIDICLNSALLDAALAAATPALRALYAKHPGRVVRLALSDTGSGMDAATVERIFEPFFTTKAVNEGTGLGLSVVHGIVYGHEGAIVVLSQPGKGTTFTLYLPAHTIAASAAETATASAPAPNAGGGLRLLYIDDDESLTRLVKRLLERSGYRVSAHTDPVAALEQLRADPSTIDLVLSDYNMPVMSGLEVARAVRTIRPDLPMAVTSGFIDETLQREAAAAGVRELIFKANSVEEFCAAVQRMARGIATTATATSAGPGH